MRWDRAGWSGRRAALLGGAALAVPRLARGQPRLLRIVSVGVNPRDAVPYIWIDQRLGELGHVEGRSYKLDAVQIRQPTEYPAAYRDAVSRGADILLAFGSEPHLRAAMAASGGRLPIVIAAIDYDPQAIGVVDSLSRPTGNITGLFIRQLELARKRFELLTESFPEQRQVAVFWDAASKDQWEATAGAAAPRGLRLAAHEFRERPYDYARAVREAGLVPGTPLLVMNSPFFFFDRRAIAEATLAQRLPAIFAWREWVDLGGLMSYGPSWQAIARRTAEYIDRIARGAKPAELPIEQPSRFELVINLKTAAAIGASLAPGVLARADAVID